MQVDWYYHLLIDSIKVNDWDFLPILRSIKWEIDSNWYPKKIPLPSISLDLHVNYSRFSDDWKTQLNTNIRILNLNELSILKVLIIYFKKKILIIIISSNIPKPQAENKLYFESSFMKSCRKKKSKLQIWPNSNEQCNIEGDLIGKEIFPPFRNFSG